MAGVKGMKGGGGARPGAGAKPAKPVRSKAKAYQTQDPDDFLRAMMADPRQPMKDRMAAALALKKSSPGGVQLGKKARQQEDAKEVVGRSLAPVQAPVARRHLTAVK